MSQDARHTLDGAAKAALSRTRTRLVFAASAFLLAYAVLVGRLVDLALLRDPTTREVARTATDASIARVDLLDRNGEILATDLKSASLYADARAIWDPAETANSIAAVLPGLDAGALTKKLATRQAFVWIKRDLSPRQQDAVYKLGIPGLHFRNEPRRVYPNGRAAAHVLGYVDVDNHGLAGIERGLETQIADQRRQGAPLELSIDLRVQHALQDELVSAMATFRSVAAVGLVMDVRNGEMLAMSSLPDFDPNERAQATPNGLFNRATLGVFEMGSTFKTFTTAMALDSGKITLESRYDATNPIQVGRFTITDFHPEKRWLTVPEIFMHSSNIGSAKIALDVGIDAQKAFLGKLGLLQATMSEIREAGDPLIPRQWNELESMTIAYGHGIAVSPMQTAMASAAIVNGGKLIKPTFVRRAPGEVVPFTRVVSEETSREMRDLLRLVVTQGTGGKADVPGYPVGGKTGTAEKAQRGGYAHRRLLSSFMGVFPAQDPAYLVLIILDEPQGTKETFGYATAGWTAAPTAGKVIARIAPLLNVPVTPDTSASGPSTTVAAYQDVN